MKNAAMVLTTPDSPEGLNRDDKTDLYWLTRKAKNSLDHLARYRKENDIPDYEDIKIKD